MHCVINKNLGAYLTGEHNSVKPLLPSDQTKELSGCQLRQLHQLKMYYVYYEDCLTRRQLGDFDQVTDRIKGIAEKC